jgi:hypothetical protein
MEEVGRTSAEIGRRAGGYIKAFNEIQAGRELGEAIGNDLIGQLGVDFLKEGNPAFQEKGGFVVRNAVMVIIMIVSPWRRVAGSEEEKKERNDGSEGSHVC